MLSPQTLWIQNTPALSSFLKGLHWPAYLLNLSQFPAVSSRFVQTNKHLHCEAVSHNKRTQSLNVVFVLSLWPQLFVAQTTCRCCSSLASVVTVTTNPVISSAQFWAKPANRCFVISSFCTPHTNQACKTTLKLRSSAQLHFLNWIITVRISFVSFVLLLEIFFTSSTYKLHRLNAVFDYGKYTASWRLALYWLPHLATQVGHSKRQ